MFTVLQKKRKTEKGEREKERARTTERCRFDLTNNELAEDRWQLFIFYLLSKATNGMRFRYSRECCVVLC